MIPHLLAFAWNGPSADLQPMDVVTVNDPDSILWLFAAVAAFPLFAWLLMLAFDGWRKRKRGGQ